MSNISNLTRFNALLEDTKSLPQFIHSDEPYINFQADVEVMPHEKGMIEQPVSGYRATLDAEMNTLTATLWKMNDTDYADLTEEPYRQNAQNALWLFIDALRPLLEKNGTRIQVARYVEIPASEYVLKAHIFPEDRNEGMTYQLTIDRNGKPYDYFEQISDVDYQTTDEVLSLIYRIAQDYRAGNGSYWSNTPLYAQDQE